MRRPPSPVVPIAFFAGCALLSYELVLFSRWPALVLRVANNDVAVDAVALPLVSADHAIAVAWLCLAVAVIAGLRRAGAVVAGSVVVGLAAVASAALVSWSTLDPLTADALVGDVLLWCPFAAVVVAGAWLMAQRPRGRSAWLAAGIAVTMMLSAALAGGAELSRLHVTGCMRPAAFDAMLRTPADWDLWVLEALSALFASGVALSYRRPLYCSRAVSTFTVLAGVLARIPAERIATESTLPLRRAAASPPRGETVAVSRCLEPLSGPVFRWNLQTGALIDGEADAETPGRVARAVGNDLSKWSDLHGVIDEEPGAFPGGLTLVVDRRVSLWIVAAAVRESAHAGVTNIQIASWEAMPALSSLRGRAHLSCATRFRVTDSGLPIESFASWPALVEAADQGRGDLEISVGNLPNEAGDYLMDMPPGADEAEFEDW